MVLTYPRNVKHSFKGPGPTNYTMIHKKNGEYKLAVFTII